MLRCQFESNIVLLIARHTGSASVLSQTGIAGLTKILQQGNVPFQRSLHKLIAWAARAAESLDHADIHQRIWTELDDDRQAKGCGIARLEQEIAGLLATTPYVLLMGIPGINVVSAGEFAGEAGPISNYATPRSITGRAGLYPSRYQSDQVDHANGPLVSSANRTLRNAIMLIADNLVVCNAYFKALGKMWSAAGRDPRAVRVRVACRFCRIAYHMVAGRQAQVERQVCANTRPLFAWRHPARHLDPVGVPCGKITIVRGVRPDRAESTRDHTTPSTRLRRKA